ncbi:LYR motif-containing protein 2 [Podila humilis]|nr:LYR motif-containing protein 2 [Podila humilis]
MRAPAIPASLSRASRRIQVQDGPNLEYFLTRARVLSLYREIHRSLKDVKNPKDRHALQEWARSDFEQYRHEKNPDKIKTLISQGKHQFHALQTNLSLSSGKTTPKN